MVVPESLLSAEEEDRSSISVNASLDAFEAGDALLSALKLLVLF